MNGTTLTNRSAVDRNKTDFYETPEDVTAALLDFLESHGYLVPPYSRIWEPACGAGKMAEVIRSRGYNVSASDLHDQGYGETGVDFITANPPQYSTWIITNPPFKDAERFIRRALDLRKPFAFLLKSQFWHAKSRLQLFRDHPPAYVLPLTWRPDFLYGAKSGSPTMEVMWSVWFPEISLLPATENISTSQ